MSFYSGTNKVSGNNSVHSPDTSDLQNRILTFDDTANVDGITSIDEITDCIKTKSTLSLLMESIKKGIVFLNEQILTNKFKIIELEKQLVEKQNNIDTLQSKLEMLTTTVTGISTTLTNSVNDLNSFKWVKSKRDFKNGTLITTNIPFTGSENSGAAYLLEIKANSYAAKVPYNNLYQGYIWDGSASFNIGKTETKAISGMVAISYNNKLCFWFPRQEYWQGFDVYCSDKIPEAPNCNRVISIEDVAKPTTYKEVAF